VDGTDPWQPFSGTIHAFRKAHMALTGVARADLSRLTMWLIKRANRMNERARGA
jgi:hypothetical protein